MLEWPWQTQWHGMAWATKATTKPLMRHYAKKRGLPCSRGASNELADLVLGGVAVDIEDLGLRCVVTLQGCSHAATTSHERGQKVRPVAQIVGQRPRLRDNGGDVRVGDALAEIGLELPTVADELRNLAWRPARDS